MWSVKVSSLDADETRVAIVDGVGHHDAEMAMGAGEEALTLGALCTSASPPLLLLLPLLATWPSSLFSLPLLLSAAEGAPESSVVDSEGLGGAVQRGISQTTPVKVLRVKPPLAHRRQGLPLRSRARRPALMAPWLALGPSLCAPAARFAAFVWSMVPSSLRRQLAPVDLKT